MVSDTIQKQVADIQERSSKTLHELSILILSLTVVFFIDGWIGDWWAVRPLSLDLPNADWIFLGYELHILVASLVFLIVVVLYFWWLRNKPQFHVLFIEREKNQEHSNDMRYSARVLIPIIGITIGLTLPLFFADLLSLTNWWQSPEQTLLWNFEHNLFAYFPLITVIVICVLLYFVYRIKPERLQRRLPGLLLVPIFLSILTKGVDIYNNASNWYSDVMSNAVQSWGGVYFTANIMLFSEFTLFLASFIVLFYLVYHIKAQYSYTFAEGEHLRGMVEKGVGILPKRVHVGDSHSIPLDLTLSEGFASGGHLGKSNEYLEAELKAVGLEFDGEKRVRILEGSPLSVIIWNCRFVESGNYTIDFLLHLVKPSNNSRHLIFSHTHDVNVTSILSVSGAPVLALVVPIVVAVVQALLKVNIR